MRVVWRLLDQRVQLQPSKDQHVFFVRHTTGGTMAAARGRLQWTVEWTAPPAASSAAVRFNLAGNASNDDVSPLDD